MQSIAPHGAARSEHVRKLADGTAPVHPDDLLYVGGRGAFEILRREVWPGERVLLTLAAWPRR